MNKKIVAILVCGVIAVGLIGCGSSSDTEEQTGTTESDTVAEFSEGEPAVYELMNGLGTEAIGEYSILEIPQSDVTMEYLTDWYENYVIPSGHNWDIIVYSDRDDNLGVWANDASMNKDVYLIPDESSGYTQGGNSPSSAGYELKDGELVEWWNVEDLGAAQGLTPEEALDNYLASGDYYPSREDFIDELEYEGYTTEEAEAAVASFDCDWNELAAEDMETWYSGPEDAEDAADMLRDDGFSEEEIQYAKDKLGIE